MQLTSIFVAFLLSTAVVAKGHNKTGTSTKSVTDKSICNKMAHLEKTVALASNTTKLDAITKNNATKIAEIKSKASSAASTLATMSSNATLVSTCAGIFATEDTEHSCEKMKSLMKTVALASNTTKLDAKAKGNETKIAELKAKASNAAIKLQTMTSNTTLMAACSSIAAVKSAAKDAKEAAASSSSSGSAAEATSTTATTNSAGILDTTTTSILSLVVLVSVGMMSL